jgi:hypothetical protein
MAAAPAFAQTPQGTPVDPAEANAGADVAPLRIGPVTLSGSMHIDALKVNDDELDEYRDEVKARRARVGLAGNITPKIGWNLSVEFTGTPGLRNAFFVYRLHPFANVRLGQATPPMSIERGTSPTALEFIDRTRLTSQLTYPQDIGAIVFSDKPVGGWLNYTAGVINGAGFNRSDDNDAKDLVGRVEVLPPGLRHTSLVVSAATGQQPPRSSTSPVPFRRTRHTAGFQVDASNIKVTAEALRENNESLALRDGFLVSAVYRYHPHRVTPHFRMIEFAARYFTFDDPLSARGLPGTVDDDAAAQTAVSVVPVTTREFQAGGNYYANRNVRVIVNVIVPVDERTTPGTTLASRFQVVF